MEENKGVARTFLSASLRAVSLRASEVKRSLQLLFLLFRRYLRAFLPRLRQTDRDCLLAALYRAAFSAFAALECATFAAAHSAVHGLLCTLAVLASSRPSAGTLPLCRHLHLRGYVLT